MAEINPNLLLQIRPQADVGRTFGSILTNVDNFDRIRENREQAPLRNQLLQQRVDSGQLINQQQEGINREQANQALTQFAARIKPMLDAGDTEGVRQLVQQQKAGPLGGAADNFLQILETNPALAKQRVDQVVELGRQSGQFGQTKSVGQREFDELIKIAQDPNSTQLEKDSARRKLGDLARVGTSAQERIAQDPELTTKVSESQSQITESKEIGKLSAQLKLTPQVKSAVSDAVELSKATAKVNEKNRSNANTLAVYEAGIGALSEALDITTTGPVSGLLPALTANQQAADGAVAAMAPILKQMFRSAGEGNFTDADQKLLLDMIPTRADLPEARAAKLKNIDLIVRAKLQEPDVVQQDKIQQPQQADFSGFKIISVE
jgi:hypothetical protein